MAAAVNYQWLEKPILEETVNLGNVRINQATSIKALESDSFVYSNGLTNRFVVFDSEGPVIRSFEGQEEHGEVKCVDVYKNQLYLAQEKQIICISNFDTEMETKVTFMPNVESLCRMAVGNDKMLICTDWEEDKVHEYNTEDNTTKTVLRKIRRPTYISVDHTSEGIRYILTLYGQCVKTNKESWDLLKTITEGMTMPRDPFDTAPCPGGFLLADRGSNEIKLYNYKGDPVKTVLTGKDGLNGPRCFTLKPSHLWVGHDGISDGSGITRFSVGLFE